MLKQDIKMGIVNGILDVFKNDVVQIILYGSVAREEETAESDIDIAVILKSECDISKREEFIEMSSELDLKYGKVISIIDIEQQKLNTWGRVLPFYKSIIEEGVLLWKAA